MVALSIAASIALGGILLKTLGKISAEKGLSMGTKRIIQHLHQKNKGKETKLSKFLGALVGMSNEELAEMVGERSDEIMEAMRAGTGTGTGKLDETGENLLAMTEQLKDMMENYNDIEKRDQDFVQRLKDDIDTNEIARQIAESLREQQERQGKQGKQIEPGEIVAEFGDMFSKLGWTEKLEGLDSRLERIDDDIKRILHRTRRMDRGFSELNDKLDGIEGIPVGDEETKIRDSVLHRSNVVTAGRDVRIISAENMTNIDASQLDRNVWKEVLSDAIRELGIDAEIRRVARLEAADQCLEESTISRKFEDVSRHHGDIGLDADHLLRLGSSLYLTGEYGKAYRYFRKAMTDREETAEDNIEKLFSDRHFRERVLRQAKKVANKLFVNLEELYERGDTRNYRPVKKVHGELSQFMDDVRLSVEGNLSEVENEGSMSGIEPGKLERLADIYEEVLLRINDLCRKSEEIRALIYSGNADGIKSMAMPMKNDVVSLRNRYVDRMSIIKEVQ